MKVIILAAGQGTRLLPLTLKRPKCLVELNGITLLQRQMSVLYALGLNDISIILGYKADQVPDLPVAKLYNHDYQTTNMVYTLFCAREIMTGEEDVLITYGDIVYEKKNLERILDANAPLNICVDRNWQALWRVRMENPLSDAETLKTTQEGWITELGKKPLSYEDIQGQYMGLIKIRKDKVKDLIDAYDVMDKTAIYDGRDYRNMYMTSFLQHLIDSSWQVRSVDVWNGWLEVDSVEDLETYHRLHKEGKLKTLCDLG